MEEMYPEGIHRSIAELPDDTNKKILARIMHTVLGDAIEDIRFDKEDSRVVNVDGCHHTYIALATPVVLKNSTYPIGTIIGDEDCGVEEEWVKALGWKSKWGKNCEPLEGEDGDY